MRLSLASIAVALWVGCGGGSSGSSAMTPGGVVEAGYGSGAESPMSDYASDSSEPSYAPSAGSPPPSAPMSAARAMYAQAAPQQAAAPAPVPGPSGDSPIATDASPGRGPLLIYEAHMFLAVFKVEENIKAVATVARESGGFLSQQTDASIVIRIPAAKFNSIIESIEAMGDVLHRQVQAMDVSEEFRDVEIRIQNSMQVRDRLAQLLTRATTVEESLQIERELERLTSEIERLKGRMRFLQDRIAYSTITVSFQPKEQERLNNDMFRLPFDWLDSLGLQRLLSL